MFPKAYRQNSFVMVRLFYIISHPGYDSTVNLRTTDAKRYRRPMMTRNDFPQRTDSSMRPIYQGDNNPHCGPGDLQVRA